MSPIPLSDPRPAPPAIEAFLRGVERRAALFADLECGEPAVADTAVEAAMHGFVAEATRIPVADWPRCFWAGLLAAPALRGRGAGAAWPPAFAALAELGRGPRAALLLGLVARLPGREAAAALGVAEPTYELALRRALAARAGGPERGEDDRSSTMDAGDSRSRGTGARTEAEAWRALDLAARDALRALPPQRLVRLARLREAAMAGRHPGAATPAPATRGVPPRRPRWLLPLLWAGLAACALGFAATFLGSRDAGPGGRRERLPEAEAPAARFDADLALLSHRDFEQLAETHDADLVDSLGLVAWYAATADAEAQTPESRDAAGGDAGQGYADAGGDDAAP